MSNEVEVLLPCPFCGGEAEIKQDSKNGFILKCKSCVIQYKQKTINHSLDWLKEKMIERWNKRAESGGGMAEALDDLLEAIPKQSPDADWWPDELTRAVEKAKSALGKP